MCFGFECENGWFDLIWNLCIQIEKENPEDFEVCQVKEKFGTLRFYPLGGAPEKIWDLIDAAEKKSETICEICGKPGTLKEHGYWLKTLCNFCASKNGYSEVTKSNQNFNGTE